MPFVEEMRVPHGTRKFSEAEADCRKNLTGDPKEGISKDAMSLWE